MKAGKVQRSARKHPRPKAVLAAHAPSSTSQSLSAVRSGRDDPAAGSEAAVPQPFDLVRLPIFAPQQAGPSRGSPVPEAIRQRVEEATCADLSGVRIHTGSDSAKSADSVGARAYTVGRDIHFGPGQFHPGTRRGDRLIAHELVHTIQQGDSPAAQHELEVSTPGDTAEVEANAIADRIVESRGLATVSQRGGPRLSRVVYEDAEGWLKDEPKKVLPPEWGKEYGTSAGTALATVRGTIGKNKDHPALASASSQGGSKLDMSQPLTLEDLEFIYIPTTGIQQKDADAVRAILPSRLDHLNNAFRAMEIDTAEAQAAFIAHSYSESWQLRKFKAEADPAVVGQFPGRGPLQTTFRQGYIKSLAYLEAQAERLEQAGATDPEKAEDAKLAREALAAIKRDPAAAEDPRFAFFLSGAMMHAAGGVAATGNLKGADPTFAGPAKEDFWMTGSVNIAGKIAYWEDLKVNGTARLAAAEAEVEAAANDAEKARKTKKRDRLARNVPAAPERVKYWKGVERAARRKDLAYDRAMDRLRPRIIQGGASPAPAP